MPISFRLFISFSALVLTFTACKKKETTVPPTPPVPPTETPVPHLIITSIAHPATLAKDTFIYDGNNRLIQYISYNNATTPTIVNENISYTYDNSGRLTKIGFPGQTYYYTVSYVTNDSLVLTYSPADLKTMYKLDTSGLPLRVYNHYGYIDKIQRLDFTWDINPQSGDVDSQHNVYYRAPNYTPEVLPFKTETYLCTYTNIENPLHPIAMYNPVFTTRANVTGVYQIPANSKHMISGYYFDRLMTSYSYTLDSLGKYPVRQVQYSTYSKDSAVFTYSYRNAD